MKKNLIVLWLLWLLYFSACCLADNYSSEYQDAYRYAYTNWITTAKTIDKANMNWILTRIAMAKMISQYAMNVLLLEPDTTVNCLFSDVSSSLNAQYGNWVTLACQLWLMWIWDNGKLSKNFKPNDIVTRWQWATVFSRALSRANGDIVTEGSPFYKPHLNYLQSKWIIKSIINPSHIANEKRWNAMIMMMRGVENIKNSGNKSDNTNDVGIDLNSNSNTNDNKNDNENKQRIEDLITDYNWRIIYWSDLRPETAKSSDNINIKSTAWGYTTITVNLTGGTIYVDYDYDFVLKIGADGVNVNTLELSYNDYSKLTTFYVYWNNKNHLHYAKVYSRTNYLSECKTTNQYGFSDLETNFQIWGGNDKYAFIWQRWDRNRDIRIKLFTSTGSLKNLVEKKHCDCKSCRVESDDW